MTWRTILLIWITSSQVCSMYIPQDVEILDGYDLDDSGEYYSSDSSSYYEAKSLASGLTKSIRNRRSPLYQALNPSDVPFVNADERAKPSRHPEDRPVHSQDVEVFDVNKDNAGKPEARSMPDLPTAEKQTMDSDYYRKSDWGGRDYSTYWKHINEGDDSAAEASNNEGIKGRTPRVNFITQAKKAGDEGNKEQPVVAKYPVPKPDYEKANYDMYPSRSYDQYLRRYDRYDDQYNRYDPYNYEDYYIRRRHYDPYDSYSPRTPSYPEPYYDYPDRRYDIPEPRDYNPLYTNDIYERSAHPTLSSFGSRRIIYYAHLPEVVRTPVTMDYNNRSNYPYDRKRYDDYGYNNNGRATMTGSYRADGSSADKNAQAFGKRDKNFAPYTNNPTLKPKANN